MGGGRPGVFQRQCAPRWSGDIENPLLFPGSSGSDLSCSRTRFCRVYPHHSDIPCVCRPSGVRRKMGGNSRILAVWITDPVSFKGYVHHVGEARSKIRDYSRVLQDMIYHVVESDFPECTPIAQIFRVFVARPTSVKNRGKASNPCGLGRRPDVFQGLCSPRWSGEIKNSRLFPNSLGSDLSCSRIRFSRVYSQRSNMPHICRPSCVRKK